MQLIPPPSTKQHWVYDDPSGVAEPLPYPKAWPTRRRVQQVLQVSPVRRHVRIAHREA